MIEKEIFDYIEKSKLVNIASPVATGKTSMGVIITNMLNKRPLYFGYETQKRLIEWYERLNLKPPTESLI
jgi:hypothetical protein